MVANVSDVRVTCSTNTYTVEGTVTGLASGQQITLKNNGADALTLTSNGGFSFKTPVTHNASYLICVATQPSESRECSVANGSATATANITNVTVSCGDVVDTVTTVAGGASGFADGTGAAAGFGNLTGIDVDGAGNLYVSDPDANRIRKIDASGKVTTVAGSGTPGYADGPATAARFSQPRYVTVDAAGNLYVSENGNHRIRKIDVDGNVTTVAGSGDKAYADGTGTAASFSTPQGMAFDAAGNLYVADMHNHRIRKIDTSGKVTTVAGSGTPGYADGTGTAASFHIPKDVAFDAAGNLYVADGNNNRIRKIDASGKVTTVAGSGTRGHADGTGTAASFNGPNGIAVNANGILYVTDFYESRVRKINTCGEVTTVAGSGVEGSADGTGTAASFEKLSGITVDGNGYLYVTEPYYGKIRKIAPAKP